ncbi:MULTISPECIES: hypothetical protein [unclassified Kitasatospora]|uniref:hypothetical protein n=1 Tax=unclassified Kitasatospora TaxID=2633591 RepID=UPI0037F56AD3
MRMPRRWFRRPDHGEEAFQDGLQRSLERFHGDLLNYPADGPWDEVAYWDPLSAVRLSGGGVGDGRWEDRSRLGVPGPFYAGMTDTGLNGPFYLPAHVLSGEEHCEFVYRQPGGLRELAALVGVAQMEPIGGFNCDGGDYWTPETVRAWWHGRDAVREWIAAELADTDGRNDPEALRGYAAYLDDGLEDYLRGYVFWLTEGREPGLDEPLPTL